jgi:hypothetical protein
MLFFAAVASAQTPPQGLDCDPMPEDPAKFEECTYYNSLNNQSGPNYDSDPANDMPATTPDYCSSGLPESDEQLANCIYYMGQNNIGNVDNTQPPVPSTNQAPGPLPGTGIPPDNNADATALGVLVSKIYLYALGLAGLLAVCVSVWGGYVYMTSRGNAAQAQKGKEWILGGLTGMLLLFGAYILLNTINTDLTDFTVDVEGINKAPSTQTQTPAGP